MTTRAPAYSIVVPAFNEQLQLARTLPAIQRAMAGLDVPGELIVVDNNSSDDTARVAAAQGAKVVFEPVNMIAKARNAGGRAASAAVLIFVDADTVPTTALLQAALDALATGHVCGGGARVLLDPPPNWVTRRLAGVWNVVSHLLGYPAGCFFFCRREAFDDVEGFSEAVYASEEIWLARRLKKWGRPRRQKLAILREPVTTSSRKMDNPVRMFAMLILMFVFPFAVRFKGLCGYWYKRTDDGVEVAEV